MSAQAINVITLAFHDPSGTLGPNDPYRVAENLSYTYSSNEDIRTLSTNGPQNGNDITGLLYTPDLPEDSPCVNASAPYVPSNVTRLDSFPHPERLVLVALAPWLSSPQCTLLYLAAAREVPTQAFLFYMPDNNTNDRDLDLGDGGDWKRQNQYPVYMLSGDMGHELVQASAQYSGNISSAPHADELLDTHDPSDYVRLYADINTGGEWNSGPGSGTHLPSLWVFLLVVLAILLIIIGATSILMHWIQRRRRRQLRQRVTNGEVDLEVLGIKRLTVPQDLLDKFPLYTYGTIRPEPAVSKSEAIARIEKDPLSSSHTPSRSTSPSPDVRPTPAITRAHSYRPSALDQPTCPICLDDFVPADPATNEPGNTVRELPCHHIFHPECVDAFLRDNSSLCPMCKNTCLPKGYCPKNVTNAMVRRERIMRRNRERGDALAVDENQPPTTSENMNDIDIPPPHRQRTSHPPTSLAQRIARRITSAPATTSPTTQQMSTLSTSPQQQQQQQQRSATTTYPAAPSSTTQIPPAADTTRRREWARQRAVAMLGRRAPPLDPEAEEAARTPRWRKVLGSIWPGIGGR